MSWNKFLLGQGNNGTPSALPVVHKMTRKCRCVAQHLPTMGLTLLYCRVLMGKALLASFRGPTTSFHLGFSPLPHFSTSFAFEQL